MKKFLISLFVIFLAYYTAYYTSGAHEKQDLFDFGKASFLYKIKCAISGETDTTDANALYERGKMYLDYEDYDLAIADYKKALLLDEKMDYILTDLAEVYLEKGDTTEAINQYYKYLKEGEYLYDTYLAIGRIYDQSGKIDSAILYYNKTIEESGGNHQAHFQLAKLYFNKRDYNEALNEINSAIDLFESELEYRDLRRRLYIKLNKKDLANEEYGYILSKDFSYFGNYEQEAKEANEKGNYQESIELYTQAIELNEYNVTLLNERGWVYHKLMQYDSALVDFKKSITISPGYYNYFSAAYTYDLLDSVEKAIEFYDMSLELKSDYHLAYNNRGYEYYRLGNIEKAIENYSLSIQFKDDYHLSYHNRGSIYFEQGDYQKAIEDYKKAKERTSYTSGIVYDMALAYDKLKDKEEAIYNFNEYIRLAQNSDTAKVNYATKRVIELSME